MTILMCYKITLYGIFDFDEYTKHLMKNIEENIIKDYVKKT